MSHTNNNSVLFNVDQSYPETSTGGASKQRARNNIGAAAASDLSAEILRATAAEKAAKTEVVAGTNISVTPSTGVNGQTIYTVSSNSSSEYFKTKQGAIDNTFADYGFIHRLQQTPNGEVSIECSYISAATSGTTGLMSNTDKSKLDAIQPNAEVNQNAFSNLKVGSTNIVADSKQSTFELKAGNNILLTPDSVNDSVTISATGTVPTAGPTDYMKVLGVLDTNGTVGWSDTSKIITRTAPYSEAVPITQLTIYDPGFDYGSLVKDQSSNNIGYLLPKHYGNQDLGKVPMVISDNGYKVEWVTPQFSSGVPEIEPMGYTSVYVSNNQPEYLNMEDGVAYWIETMSGGSFVVHLGTQSTKTIHNKIFLVGTQANCVTMTIVYEDEAGLVQQLDFVYGDTQSDTIYALDVYSRKVTISGSISFDTTMCRVYDYPCQTRDYFTSDNNNIGLINEYVEPL